MTCLYLPIDQNPIFKEDRFGYLFQVSNFLTWFCLLICTRPTVAGRDADSRREWIVFQKKEIMEGSAIVPVLNTGTCTMIHKTLDNIHTPFHNFASMCYSSFSFDRPSSFFSRKYTLPFRCRDGRYWTCHCNVHFEGRAELASKILVNSCVPGQMPNKFLGTPVLKLF